MGFKDRLREQAEQAEAVKEHQPHSGVEYRVEQVRESLLGEKFSPGSLEGLLNDRADEGWTLRQIIKADVKGRVGPGGVGGLLVVFERPA